jgi:hypothetical protein|nr:MAG TPA: hypothetical protein [Caudoviricetes sp.]
MIDLFRQLRFTQKIFFVLFLPLILVVYVLVFIVKEFMDANETFEEMLKILLEGLIND